MRSRRSGATIEETVDPRAMPLTGLANAAIDRVAPDGGHSPPGWRATPRRISPATAPKGRGSWSIGRQQGWDALLAWARRRYDVDFVTTSGLVHVAQPPATVERLAHAVAALDAFRLAGLSPLVTIGGSLIAALGVLRRRITPDAGVGGGQHRRALADRAMGCGCRGRDGAGEPAARLLRRARDSWSCSTLSAAGRSGRGRTWTRPVCRTRFSRSAATIDADLGKAWSMSWLTRTYSYSAQWLISSAARRIRSAITCFAIGAAAAQPPLKLVHRRRKDEDR